MSSLNGNDRVFQRIGKGIEEYRRQLGYPNYRYQMATKFKTAFEKWIFDEALVDESIGGELGSHCDPNDSNFSTFDGIPLPPYARVRCPSNKDKYRFYILQYIYTKEQVPTTEYICKEIIPKCDGKIIAHVSRVIERGSIGK
mmetsp:Transcript_75807/g.67971  ORF Transcript_75807/g.67971 Transcript_75807/m.67971 type:complete len:142 (-) Transcript_75807:115-540(-)|eukprot:CAMPEP_0201584422 /NCGR_PEP_ID=MMETSP0190_2-20130828/110447_1 /ASSEMBLY_ACC=CAM_ASM_000263 /TAXON_ID=37353 /ORGANISM="Rosalina sp." /LENGTH=141 /DNA_ID=CAMNT_0048028349 /DNA_START=22 /DNA_END=447 /DNA_ORIENTATION=-